jgi:hypothetical protein
VCAGPAIDMEEPVPYNGVRQWRLRPLELGGALAVLVSRLLTLPRSPWELDELLFTRAVIDFDPVQGRPHPPGYPLLVGLGKLVHLMVADPWLSLVVLSVIASVIGCVAFARAASRFTGSESTGCIAALAFYFSSSMLVHGTLALSDAPMLMFVALALERFAAYREAPGTRRALAAGAWIAAAIGTRPQMAIALLPALVVMLLLMRAWRDRAFAMAAFVLVCLLWFVPLVQQSDGWEPFVAMERGQASYVASHDAQQSRGARSLASVAVRFILHPWGPKVIALPVMLLAAAGAFVAFRRRNRVIFLPLVALTIVHVAFAIQAMDPADAARYSLPSMLLVAMFAALGLELLRVRAIAWVALVVFASASLAYVWPIVSTRHHIDSPPFQAATYASGHFAPNTVILYDLSLRPHAESLFSKFRSRSTESGLNELYAQPGVPLVHLADGGSKAPGAISFQWPESDAYGKITRNHYRVVSLEPVPPRTRFLPIRGVSAPERTTEGASWRWLAPAAFLKLPPQGGSRVILRMSLSPDAPYDTNRVIVLVDGVERAAGVVARAGSSIEVPLAGVGPGVVNIRSEDSFVPADVIGNHDTRRVAVKLLSLEQQ